MSSQWTHSARRLVSRATHVASWVVLLAVSAAAADEPDPLCPELVKFANATTDHSVHSVVLMTDWAHWSNGCRRDKHYAPGRRLCKYLGPHTSMEFQILNLRRVLACLRIEETAQQSGTRRFTTSNAPGVKPGVAMVVEYSPGDANNLPSLEISAQMPLQTIKRD